MVENRFAHIFFRFDDEQVLTWLVDHELMQHPGFPTQVLDIRACFLDHFVQHNKFL